MSTPQIDQALFEAAQAVRQALLADRFGTFSKSDWLVLRPLVGDLPDDVVVVLLDKLRLPPGCPPLHGPGADPVAHAAWRRKEREADQPTAPLGSPREVARPLSDRDAVNRAASDPCIPSKTEAVADIDQAEAIARRHDARALADAQERARIDAQAALVGCWCEYLKPGFVTLHGPHFLTPMVVERRDALEILAHLKGPQ